MSCLLRIKFKCVFNYEMLNTYFYGELKVFYHIGVWITMKCQNVTFMDIL